MLQPYRKEDDVQPSPVEIEGEPELEVEEVVDKGWDDDDVLKYLVNWQGYDHYRRHEALPPCCIADCHTAALLRGPISCRRHAVVQVRPTSDPVRALTMFVRPFQQSSECHDSFASRTLGWVATAKTRNIYRSLKCMY
nr:hypothetical protein CFP56_04491 [Quercus suber]